ncbi:hypothetical protein RhiXN_11191 [Rhizoctonia solani]|uniref:Uncharacterized protein n=1 Tax=Rhizoctonia solani TaxID=456999 RepID=A0A8H8T1S3_9AGAM|nr:uncharacterized protein RhiXN_11191 [Rhizoctonia solani]QRW26114.1 hypothetical protein RhiXN_11191 [Rhizoctonia solani]
MSLLCFSLAATLRCAGIPRIQSEVLIIPPALEALTSLFLIWTVWRNGRKRWLLVAEAWMFLILAILDYVSHALVRGMSSVSVFEPMDKAVGALSGIPILAYTSFLFLLIRSDLLPTITPSILRTTLQFTLISLIPPTIMSYELGSLLGVTYRINPITLVPETGFANLTTRSLSMGPGQSAVFVSAMGGRARSNSTSTSYLGDERGIRGLSWLALGLAIGATETLLSLGAQTFILVLVRRILRVLARASLITRSTAARATDSRISKNREWEEWEEWEDQEEGKWEESRDSFRTPGSARLPNSRPPRRPFTTNETQSRIRARLMRFSGLDVPDSSEFRARSGSGSGSGDGSVATSMLGHGGHSTRTPLSRTRTLSEKRHAERKFIKKQYCPARPESPAPVSVRIPNPPRIGLSNRSSSTQSLSRNRSNSNLGSSEEPGSYERSTSLEGVRELTNQFPVIPARAMVRRGPTQLAYAVQEEDEIDSSCLCTGGAARIRQEDEDGGVRSISGEQVVVDTHSALFPPERYDYTSSRASSDSGTFTLTATGTPSPAEIITGRPARLAERAAQLERQERQERLSGEEHAWMMRAPQVPVQMSQSVITRTPELKTVADFESSRVELEGAASPKSAWSARTRGSVLGLNMGMNTSQAGLWPGSNVEGWGRKLSDTDRARSLRV